jgi:plasmid stability protein
MASPRQNTFIPVSDSGPESAPLDAPPRPPICHSDRSRVLREAKGTAQSRTLLFCREEKNEYRQHRGRAALQRRVNDQSYGTGLQPVIPEYDVYMCNTCNYTIHMPKTKMIQLRNVPDLLHRSLKARAAMAGMSLSDYLLAEIKEIAERPTLAELRDRLHTRERVSLPVNTARLVREVREERDAR